MIVNDEEGSADSGSFIENHRFKKRGNSLEDHDEEQVFSYVSLSDSSGDKDDGNTRPAKSAKSLDWENNKEVFRWATGQGTDIVPAIFSKSSGRAGALAPLEEGALDRYIGVEKKEAEKQKVPVLLPKSGNLDKLFRWSCDSAAKGISERALAILKEEFGQEKQYYVWTRGTHKSLKIICSKGWKLKHKDGKRTSKYEQMFRGDKSPVCSFCAVISPASNQFSNVSNFGHTCRPEDPCSRKRGERGTQLVEIGGLQSFYPVEGIGRPKNIKAAQRALADNTGTIHTKAQARAVVKARSEKGEYVDVYQFALLADLFRSLEKNDPNGVYIIEVEESKWAKNTLSYCFALFGFVRDGVHASRGGDVLSLDAAHLTGTFGGRLWLCTESDGDRHDSIIAVAISAEENGEYNAKTLALVRKFFPQMRVVFQDKGRPYVRV